MSAPTQQPGSRTPGASVTRTTVFLAGPGDVTLTVSTPPGVDLTGRA